MGNSQASEEVYLRYITEYNEQDLEMLLKTYREGLYLFLLGYVKSREDAEELLMDTFAKLAVDKPRFDPGKGGSFRSWLYTIARNHALMHIRKRRFATVPIDDDMVSMADTPESALLKDDRNRKLYLAMSALRPKYRTALSLLYLDGLTREEIAQAMGLNLKQVYNLIERGKKALKDELEGMGIHDI